MGEMNAQFGKASRAYQEQAADERIGEVQMAYNALYRRLASIEQRLRRLENPTPMTGTIDGLEGEWTVTPPPRFET